MYLQENNALNRFCNMSNEQYSSFWSSMMIPVFLLFCSSLSCTNGQVFRYSPFCSYMITRSFPLYIFPLFSGCLKLVLGLFFLRLDIGIEWEGTGTNTPITLHQVPIFGKKVSKNGKMLLKR